jgi:hypothetical protein
MDMNIQERIDNNTMIAENEKKSVTEAEKADPPKEKSLLEIAEVRMVLYVVPMAVLLAIIGYILSRLQ